MLLTTTLHTGAAVVVPSFAEVGTVITLPVKGSEPDQEFLDNYDHDAEDGDEYNILSQKWCAGCGPSTIRKSCIKET